MNPIMVDTLGDAVSNYLRGKIPLTEGNLEFGTLREFEEGVAIRSAMIYDAEGIVSGSVDIHKEHDRATIRYAADGEQLELRITPIHLRIKSQSPDQERDGIGHRHALKHDWITPEPVVLRKKGDYAQQISAIRQTFDALYGGQESVLKIPNPL